MGKNAIYFTKDRIVSQGNQGGAMKTLADVLRDWRRAHFMSQTELAEKLGVTWGTVQRWEASKGLPFPAKQRKLIEVLEISPEDLRAALDVSEDAIQELGSKIAA